jgi:transcriptional regulator with XRE-family HTH domain
MLEKRALKKAPKPTDRHVGRRIRVRRRALGISQTALGEAVGVTFQQIQKYENGTNRIGAGRLQEIADALECEPAWFFQDRPGSPRVKPDAAQCADPELSAFLADAHASDMVRRFVRLPPRIKRAIAYLIAAIAASLERP